MVQTKQASITNFFGTRSGNPVPPPPPKSTDSIVSSSSTIPVQDGNGNGNAIYVYTDGSCIHNGTPKAKAGMGVYFGQNDPRNVSKQVVGKQSNNTGELGALLEAMTIMESYTNADPNLTVVFVTDSKYSMLCLTSFGEKNSRKQWSDSIPNKELVREVYTLYSKYARQSKWKAMHVMAHTNGSDVHSIGNDYADRLANEAIANFGGSGGGAAATDKRIYLKVPFQKKDQVKEQGGKWDPVKKKWYISSNHPNCQELSSTFSRGD
jgi:ribonuclease HI